MSFIVVSYYTAGTGYEQVAKALKTSLVDLGIEHDIEPIESLGSWQANTQHKPAFLKKMLKRHWPKAVVWVDADAVVRRAPVLFGEIEADLGVCFRREQELLSGTLYFENNLASMQILNDWIVENLENPDLWDQVNLAAVVSRREETSGLRVFRLPYAYCRIFDAPDMGVGEAVIEHFQASRRFKEEVRR